MTILLAYTWAHFWWDVGGALVALVLLLLLVIGCERTFL